MTEFVDGWFLGHTLGEGAYGEYVFFLSLPLFKPTLFKCGTRVRIFDLYRYSAVTRSIVSIVRDARRTLESLQRHRILINFTLLPLMIFHRQFLFSFLGKNINYEKYVHFAVIVI